MLWVLDHRRDLDADFRAIFHLSPAEALRLPGPEWFGLAWRCGAYQGVIASLVASDQNRQQARPDRPGAPNDRVEVVESTPAAIAANPALSAVISFGGG